MVKRTTILLTVIIVVLLIALMLLFQNPGTKSTAREITNSEFLTMEPHLRAVVFHGDAVTGHDDKNAAFAVTLPHDPAIATRLAQNHVSVLIGAPSEDSQNWLTTLLVNGLPLIAYVFLLTWPLYRIAKSLDALTSRLDRQGPPGA